MIYAYRVFPTPDDNCANDSSNDPQCGASTVDIADAIDDAVDAERKRDLDEPRRRTRFARRPACDSDPTEGAAVAEAIEHNIIVVAASGNSGGSGVGAPACDSGVIAVGATSLSDGTANGSGNTSGTAAAPVEYVTNYTQYGSPNTLGSPSSWGIVAPGGDPQRQQRQR